MREEKERERGWERVVSVCERLGRKVRVTDAYRRWKREAEGTRAKQKAIARICGVWKRVERKWERHVLSHWRWYAGMCRCRQENMKHKSQHLLRVLWYHNKRREREDMLYAMYMWRRGIERRRERERMLKATFVKKAKLTKVS